MRSLINKENIKTTFKPVETLGSIFKKPKDRPTVNQIKGIVYEVKCKTWDFTYVNNESAIRHHAETTDHDIHPDYV